MIGFVNTISGKIEPYRKQIVKQLQIMILYMLLGIFVVTIFSIILSISISYFFAIFMVAVYFVGLYLIRKKTSRLTA